MNKRGLFLLLPLAMFFASPPTLEAPQTKEASKEHKLVVKKVQNQWKVILEGDTVTTPRAKRGERVTWTAESTDVYFQFMDIRLFGDYTRRLKEGQKLTLVVSANATIGENRYAAFCYADKQYATGDSPPRIIIE